MEKICIVKRRREYTQPEVKVSIAQPEVSEAVTPEASVNRIPVENTADLSDKKATEFDVIKTKSPANITFSAEEIRKNIALENHVDFNDKKIVEEFTDKSSSVISIIMTKEQSDLLKQSEYIKELLSGIKNDPA